MKNSKYIDLILFSSELYPGYAKMITSMHAFLLQ